THRREVVEILGDPLIGVLGRRLVQLHPVISLVFEPVAQEVPGQPTPPADMKYGPQIKRIDGVDDHCGRDHAEDGELPPKLGPVILLKRIVEIVVPRIKPDIQPHGKQVERDDGGEQPTCRPFLVGLPIRQCHVPGPPQKALLRRCRHSQTPSFSPSLSFRFMMRGPSCVPRRPSNPQRPPHSSRGVSAARSTSSATPTSSNFRSPTDAAPTSSRSANPATW